MKTKNMVQKLAVAILIGIVWFGLSAVFWIFSNAHLGGCASVLEIEQTQGNCGGPSLIYLLATVVPYLGAIFLVMREKK